MAVLKRSQLTHENSQSISETSNKRQRVSDSQSVGDAELNEVYVEDQIPSNSIDSLDNYDYQAKTVRNDEFCDLQPSCSTVSHSSVASDVSLGLWAAAGALSSASLLQDCSLQNWVSEGQSEEQDTASSPESGFASDGVDSDDELTVSETESAGLQEANLAGIFALPVVHGGNADTDVTFPVFGQHSSS